MSANSTPMEGTPPHGLLQLLAQRQEEMRQEMQRVHNQLENILVLLQQPATPSSPAGRVAGRVDRLEPEPEPEPGSEMEPKWPYSQSTFYDCRFRTFGVAWK